MAVKIEVSGHLLESSETCWIVTRPSKKKDTGELYFGSDRSYYNSFDSALRAIFNMKLRASDAKSVLQLRDVAHNALSEIKQECAPLRAEGAL